MNNPHQHRYFVTDKPIPQRAKIMMTGETLRPAFTLPESPSSAGNILKAAGAAIENRAVVRDCPDGERSMIRAVAAFNAMTGHSLSEVDGWHFMELLKIARATAGGFHLDDYIDRAGYAALAGEAAAVANMQETGK